jgi:hypothetical protein
VKQERGEGRGKREDGSKNSHRRQGARRRFQGTGCKVKHRDGPSRHDTGEHAMEDGRWKREDRSKKMQTSDFTVSDLFNIEL